MKNLLIIPFFLLIINLYAHAQQREIIPATESVYLHTDQSIYVTGNRITFHVYVLPGMQTHVKETSNYVYIDFVSPDGHILHHDKIKLTQGVAKGDILINRKLSQGYYRIFAWTVAMVRHENAELFSVEIPVYNLDEIAGLTYSDAEEKDKFPHIQFFPEGGIFLAEVRNRIAFHIENFSLEYNLSFAILNSNNEEVAALKFNNNFGVADFIPKSGVSYKMKAFNNIFPLPVVQDSGVVLRIDEKAESYLLTISHSNISVNEITLSGISCYNVVYQQTMNLADFSGKSLILELRKSDLPGGLIRFLVSDGEVRFSERIIFNKVVPDYIARIDTERELFGKNEEVLVRVSIQNHFSKPVKSILTASVLRNDHASYLNGLSDPEHIFKSLKANVSVAFINFPVHDFLITRQYDCVAQKPGEPELRQTLQLTIDKSSPGYADNISFVTAYFIEDGIFAEVRPENGKIDLKIPDLEHDNHVWFSGYNNFGIPTGDLKMIMSDSMPTRTYATTHRNLNLMDEPLMKFLDRKAKYEAILKVYGVLEESASDDADSPKPDLLIRPDIYKDVTSFREFIDAIVPRATVKRRKGVDNVYLTPSHTYNRFRESPLYFVNDIPVFNGATILDIELKLVDHVEIFNSFSTRAKFGISGINGVFKVILKENATNPLEANTKNLMVINGLKYSSFTSSGGNKPDEEEVIYPDFRTLLLTSHPVKSDVNGNAVFSFFTSDVTGTYLIIIRGITEDGAFIYEEKSIRVVNLRN